MGPPVGCAQGARANAAAAGDCRPRPGSRGAARGVEITEGSPARLKHAKALVALGSALRRAGKRSAVRESLRQGLELAAYCGATPLADQARTEL